MNAVRRIFGPAFSFAGLMHFMRSEGFEAIVPNFLPFKKGIVWISGVMEIIFGILLLVRKPSSMTKKLIEWFLVAVFPANVYMAQKNIPLNGKQLPTWALWGRLPLQYVLIKIVRKM